MVTRFNLVFSKAAIARILKVSKSDVLEMRLFFKVVWVHLKGQRPTFISKKVFLQHFADWRKERSSEVVLWPDRELQGVWQSENGYQVIVSDDFLSCECEDFKNQNRAGMKKCCCKHLYKGLELLGYGSLKDYLARPRPQPVAA